MSDHGTQFVAIKWKTTLASLGIRVLYSSIRHPQSNPVERTMREIGRVLRTYCGAQHTKWATYINFMQDCLNLTTHQSTGFTPYQLHFNRLPNDKILEIFPRLQKTALNPDVQLQLANDRLQRAFERRCASQKSVSKIKLSVGDLVLLRAPHLSDTSQQQIHKLFHIYEGPCKISQKRGENAFELVWVTDESRIKGIFNRLNLRKYYPAANTVY